MPRPSKVHYSLVLAIQTHSDDAHRRAAVLDAWQSRSWQGSAHAIFRCPDGTRPSTPIIPAPLTAAVQLAAPPTASQLLTAHCLRAQRKLAAAVPGVVRTSSSCACTQDGASWCRHNTCAAASPGMGRIPRRKSRCALSAAAHHRRRLLSGPTARPFARECTSGPINIMTVPTSYMYWPTTLAAGRLRAAALSHTVAPSASIHMKVNIPKHIRFMSRG